MAARNPNHMKNLVPFKKGDKNINRNGRPRKFVTTLKEQGYKLSEVTDSIEVLISMTPDELQKIFDNPKSTVLEKVVASAIIKSIKQGDLNSIETLLNRAYGKPKEKMEADITITNHTIKLKFGNNNEEDDETDV
jgi:hypothetical protein